MTLPVAAGGQIESVVLMVQLIFIGMLGPAALSAVGIAQVFTRVLFTAMMSISRGALTMVAQAIGADSMREASASAKQAFSLLFFFSIAFGLGSLALSPFLIPVMTSDPEVAAMGTPYLQVFFIGVPFMTLNRAITSCFQGAGDTRTPFFLSLISSSIQIVMCYLLIFGHWGLPELGVVGAAVGGLLGAQYGNVDWAWGVFIAGVLRSHFCPIRPTGLIGALRAAFSKLACLLACKAFCAMAQVWFISNLLPCPHYLQLRLAAYAIGSQLEHILRRTGLSFGTVATAMVGQHLGAKDPAGAERHGWTILFISVVTNIALSLPAVVFAGLFMSVFTDAQKVISTGVIYLYAMVIAEPFLCASNTSSGSLRGAGDTMPPMYYTLIAQWLVRLPVAYVLGFMLGFDIYGIWAALIVYSIVQGVLTVRKFAQGHWKMHQI